MSRNQSLPQTLIPNGVRAILGFHFQNRPGPNIAQVNAAFDLGLHNIVIDRIAQVRAGLE
jgi:hypothetical protein